MKNNYKYLSTRTKQITHNAIVNKMSRAKGLDKQACFIIFSGLDAGKVFSVDHSGMLIGRHPKCRLVLRDNCVSRLHAKVQLVQPDSLFINDLDSTNGMFYRGEKVSECFLMDGDKVLLGKNTVLRFALLDELDLACFKQMYDISTRDALTGAFNRTYFFQKVRTDLSFTRRHKIPFSLLVIDIDHFKKVNDTYGHQTGDLVLASVTSAASQMVRTDDVLARFGGEEFVVMTKGSDLAGSRVLGERIRQRIAKQPMKALNGSTEKFRVTVSVGIAIVPPGAKVSQEAILAAADKNLYEAKETGRNKVVASEITE